MVIGIIVIAIVILKLTGVYDVTTLFNNSSDNSDFEVIDEWNSEPFGDLQVKAIVKSCSNNSIYLSMTSESEDFKANNPSIDEFGPFQTSYRSTGNYTLDNISYGDTILMDGGENIKTGELYSLVEVPLECEYAILDGERINLVSGQVKTTDGISRFKLCLTTYYDGDQENHELIFVDKEGNKHLIVDE